MADEREEENNGKANRLGLFLAFAFYLLAVVMVWRNGSGDSLIDSDIKTLTIAHWQLEDGFRHGIDKAIEEYQTLKASQGVKVKIAQSTVPHRGYSQWFVTQLISGDPADIIELTGSSQLHSQYFLPLSNYISEPNPYNKGTPLEGIPWKDTYIDNMNTALDPVYTEYFGVGTFFHVQRVYVNQDLLKKATGSIKMPETFNQWLKCCRKLKEYGQRIGKPIIPIGVRGLDKVTVQQLFRQLFSQLNGDLVERHPEIFGNAGIGVPEMLDNIEAGSIDRSRLTEAVDLLRDLGQYFSEGFVTTDLEQSKFLFFTGNVGFYTDGTWDAWSIIRNTPFKVGVITVPVLGPDNRYYKHFTGQPSESGVGVGGKFGITKASKNKDLAIDFLRFLTSYRINQMTMMEYCKWPAAVRKAKYEGLLTRFKPVEGDGVLPVTPPFYLSVKSKRQMLQSLERIIIEKTPDASKLFWRDFIGNLPTIREELQASIDTSERNLFDIEAQRSSLAVGMMRTGISQQQQQNDIRRQLMGLESLTDWMRSDYLNRRGLKAIDKIEEKSVEDIDELDMQGEQ